MRGVLVEQVACPMDSQQMRDAYKPNCRPTCVASLTGMTTILQTTPD